MKPFLKILLSVITALSALLAASLPIYAEGGLDFTPEEQRYISEHKTLKIGYVQDRIPVSFSDENGELCGISKYIFQRVSELCGIEFEYVPLPAGDITYDYLLGEGLDLVSSVEYNKENQNARGILISNPYLSSKKVVVSREGVDFSYGANLSIAITTGSQTIRKVLGGMFPNFSIVDYDSIPSCFEAVKSGEADLLMQNQYVVEYWIRKPIYEKLKVIPVVGLDDELSFSAVVAFGGGEGTSQEEGELLISILNKAIGALTDDEVGNYIIQGVMENQYRYNLSDFLYRYRYAVRSVIIFSAVTLILVILLVSVHMRYAENKADAKVRSNFLSTMSHEIRTPLNGIIGLNYLMLQKLDDPEKLRNCLDQSNITAKYLLSLVNDMLDMSSIQADNLQLASEPIDISLIAESVNTISENAAASKGIRYSSEFDIAYPYIKGDAVRIQQVLLHLLDNARKFTPKGGKVHFTIVQQPDGDKIVTTATVADTGRGMSEEFQRRIFDTFSRELETVSKGNQGAGLGLSISSRLAKLMNGSISFTSKKGEGSTFVFTFSAEPSEKPGGDGEEKGAGKAAFPKILIAEDNELNGEILLELLSDSGFDAELVSNGREALDRFSESVPGTFGLILMDLLMPDMDGFESAKCIRALQRPDAATVHIFACTANTFDGDRDRAFASGMDDFITKPVDIEKLIAKINRL